MQIISISKNFTEGPNGPQTLVIDFETDSGSITTSQVSETSSRYARVNELVEVVSSRYSDNDEKERAYNALAAILDIPREIRRNLNKLNTLSSNTVGRFTVNDTGVNFDGEPLEDSLSTHILKMLDQSGTPRNRANWEAFAKFVENLYTNTDQFVREQLFSWMNNEANYSTGFTLTSDGCFIAYKGCGLRGETPVSGWRGHAIVDEDPGNDSELVEYDDEQIPNVPGTVILMPRQEVQNNPEVGCAVGLHVATMEFARGYASNGGVILSLKVNPKDVVSVPTECDAQKVRVCRYEVLEVVDEVYSDCTYDDGSDDYDDWDEDYDDDWEDADDEYYEENSFDVDPAYGRNDSPRTSQPGVCGCHDCERNRGW